MINNSIDSQEFMNKIRNIVANDKRSPLQIGGKKSPKMEFLQSIIGVIELLFYNLYSATEQLSLVNGIDRKICISDTTYFKFLDLYLKEGYLKLKRNRLFVSRILLLKENYDAFPDDLQAQFAMLGEFSEKHNLTFEEFEEFINEYYLKESGEFFARKTFRDRPIMGEQRIVRKDRTVKYESIIVEPSESLKDVYDYLRIPKTHEVEGSLAQGVVAKTKAPSSKVEIIKAPSVSSRNTLIPIESAIISNHYSSHMDMFNGLENEEEIDDSTKLFHLLEGASLDNVINDIKIVENKPDFPKEIKGNTYTSSSVVRGKILEKYIYLKDIEYMKWLDLSRLDLKDYDFIIAAKSRSSRVYYAYRYFNGALHLLEEDEWSYTSEMKEKLNNEFNENCSSEMLVFEKAFAKRECK